MIIFDNSALIYLEENEIKYTKECFITPEIKEEFEVKSSEDLSDKFLDITKDPLFNFNKYLNNYKLFLNSYKYFSLYNLRGLGDVSILAAVKTILEQEQIELGIEITKIITDDDNLKDTILETFDISNVIVESSKIFIKF